MQEVMKLSINGVSKVPPGFRFHPTEEELLHYYLKKKVSSQKIDLDVIPEVDLNKLEPWDIQEKCKIGSTQNDWYLFSHKDKKYPTGSRTNRATGAGFWKATGRDKIIKSCFKRIGLRKTLVFYKGRAPHGQKSEWIMHEYRLDDNIDHNINHIELSSSSDSSTDPICENGWVVCRVFMKKNYQKVLGSPKSCSNYSVGSSMQTVYSNEILDQILNEMGQNNITTISNCKIENNDQYSPNHMDIIISNQPNIINNNIFCINDVINTMNGDEKFMHLPKLENPTILNNTNLFKSCNDPTLDERFDQQRTENFNGQDLQSFDATFGICSGYDVDEENYIQLSRDVNYNLNIDTSSINEASIQIYNTNQNQNDLWSSFSNGSSTSNPL